MPSCSLYVDIEREPAMSTSAKESSTARRLPRAIQWVFHTNKVEIIISVSAFSHEKAQAVEVQVLGNPVKVATGEDTPLALLMTYADGTCRRFAMAKIDDRTTRDIAKKDDLLLMEVDRSCEEGYRYRYLAKVRKLPGADAMLAALPQ